MVMDFRGPPIIPVGDLCNDAADITGVQELRAKVKHSSGFLLDPHSYLFHFRGRMN